jgi:hypothetical protein
MLILEKWLGKFFGTNITTFAYPFKRNGAVFSRTPLALLGLFLCVETAHAGFERIAQPPKVSARGLSSLFSGDVESLSLNPSTIASLQSLYVSVFVSPSPFDLPQLSNGGVYAAAPLKPCNAGIALASAGFSLYRELTATLTLAKAIEGGFFIGCNINFNHLAIANYGSASTVGIDLAGSAQLADDVRWGFSLLNINRPTIGDLRDELPQMYLTGVTCELLSTASVSLALVKDVRFPTSVRMGVEFSPYEIVDVRFGMSNEPSRYFCGVGIHYLSVSLDYAVATHLELGLTHSFGISFAL